MTIVMGVLNVTPDSFSDGGRHDDAETAVAHGRLLASQGAGIVDVGGESTRPGAARVPEAEEMARVIPVIAALAAHGITCSVDTMRASVARAAVADLGVDYVAMHWRGHSEVMQQHTDYTDVVADVAAELAARRNAALAAGIAAERIILDPGIGFAKTSEQNWQLLRGLDVLQAMGHRLLVGVSRKRFLGELLDGRPATDRDAATAAVTTWCSLHGIWAVRTHEVPAQRDAARVGWRLGARAAG